MTKIIELRPNKHLCNANFEKYQFSAKNVTIKRKIPLITDIFRKETSLNQDSWLEVQLFAFHNHLFTNPYDNSCWFIDKEGKVWKSDENGLIPIYQVHSNLNESVYNPTVAFTTDNIVVILNGNKTLEMLIIHDHQNVESFTFTDVEPGVILDVRYVKEKLLLIVAICGIIEIDRKKHCQVSLYTYSCKIKENSIQIQDRIRTQFLRVKGAIEYLYIEESGDYFHIASQDSVVFHFDSLNPIKDDTKEQESRINIPKYSWSQDEDSLSVWVKIPEKYTATEAKVQVTLTNISIVIGNSELIQGETPHRLEADLTTWKRNEDTLELELFKHENGLMWNELIKGDTGGECLPNAALTAEIHSKLAHLCTDQPQNSVGDGQPALGFNVEQLEECDLQGRENLLQRINFNTHDSTHLAMLGNSNRILFTRKFKNGHMICLRHDHDGCVWISGKGDEESWELEHKFTFPGFGYIEASKTNKKFCVCPFNGSYVVILEHTRHAFIYEKPENNIQVGKQRIVDFCIDSPIVGATAIDNYLYVLTMNVLYQLQVFP